MSDQPDLVSDQPDLVSDQPNDDRGPRASARAWVGLAVMALPIFMLSTDSTVLFLAIPAIGADLAPVGSQSLWILHIGEFLAAASVITFGFLANRIGPRRLLMVSVAVYGAASVAAAFSTSAGMLIGARALLGLAGGAFTPAAFSLVRTMFRDEQQFRVAFSIVMASFLGGAAAGPPLGGILLERFWWGAVFLVNVPAALALLLAGPFVPASDRSDRAVRIDATSVVLSITMVMSLVYGLQEIADRGPAVLPVVAVAAGLALSVVFVRRQRRIDHPLLDLSLFDARFFRILLVIGAVGQLAFAATDMLLAQYLQVVRSLGAFQAGMLMTVPAAGGILGTLLTPRLQKWLPPAATMAVTLTLAATAAGAAFALLPTAGLPMLVVVLSSIALASAPFMSLTSQLIVTSVPTERTGSAVAVSDVFAGIGMAGGLAVVGSLSTAVYRARLTEHFPDGLNRHDLEAARDSVGGTVAHAEQLPHGLGSALLETASEAFTAATRSAYLAAAVLAVLLAILAAARLRHLPDEHST